MLAPNYRTLFAVAEVCKGPRTFQSSKPVRSFSLGRRQTLRNPSRMGWIMAVLVRVARGRGYSAALPCTELRRRTFPCSQTGCWGWFLGLWFPFAWRGLIACGFWVKSSFIAFNTPQRSMKYCLTYFGSILGGGSDFGL
jgi:hypothetical protein